MKRKRVTALRAVRDAAYRRALGVPEGERLPRVAGTSGRTPAAGTTQQPAPGRHRRDA